MHRNIGHAKPKLKRRRLLQCFSTVISFLALQHRTLPFVSCSHVLTPLKTHFSICAYTKELFRSSPIVQALLIISTHLCDRKLKHFLIEHGHPGRIYWHTILTRRIIVTNSQGFQGKCSTDILLKRVTNILPFHKQHQTILTSTLDLYSLCLQPSFKNFSFKLDLARSTAHVELYVF